MYNNNFVLAIKVDGKVLREFADKVYLPFGSEYSIFLKNLTTKRARVSISIDGDDALDGTSIIVDGMSSVDIKRFIRNGNYETGNSFKFIEKTNKISEYRGDRAEDGLVTITYEFENDAYKTILDKYQAKPYITTPDYYWPYDRTITPSWTVTCNSGVLRGTTQSTTSLCSATDSRMALDTMGITAPGSVNNQKFMTTTTFYGNGIKHSMTLRLMGEEENREVKVPIAVKKLKKCQMCGTNVRQISKFCHECGSAVEIY